MLNPVMRRTYSSPVGDLQIPAERRLFPSVDGESSQHKIVDCYVRATTDETRYSRARVERDGKIFMLVDDAKKVREIYVPEQFATKINALRYVGCVAGRDLVKKIGQETQLNVQIEKRLGERKSGSRYTVDATSSHRTSREPSTNWPEKLALRDGTFGSTNGKIPGELLEAQDGNPSTTAPLSQVIPTAVGHATQDGAVEENVVNQEVHLLANSSATLKEEEQSCWKKCSVM